MSYNIILRIKNNGRGLLGRQILLRDRLGTSLCVGGGESLTPHLPPPVLSLLLKTVFISLSRSRLTFILPVLFLISLQKGREQASCCVCLAAAPHTKSVHFCKKNKQKIL